MKGIPHCCWSWRAMPPSTWSTPRRSRPSERRGGDVNSGGSGRSGASSAGGWAGDVDGDTASGGAALAGGARRQAPGDQCHHQSHLPPPCPWRGSPPTPPPALRRFPWRWRWPRVPDREGWRRAAWRDGREGGDCPTARPPQPGPPLRGRAHQRSESEGAGVSAPVTRPTGRPAVAEEPSGAEGCLATSSKGWR